jgi:hypothetical protein
MHDLRARGLAAEKSAFPGVLLSHLRAASTLQIPDPCAEMNRNTKQ